MIHIQSNNDGFSTQCFSKSVSHETLLLKNQTEQTKKLSKN